jgi:hypothetical protein
MDEIITVWIQHYVIKFVSDFAVGRWFCPGTTVSSTNKTDHHDITEILLKVAINTIKVTLNKSMMINYSESYCYNFIHLIASN